MPRYFRRTLLFSAATLFCLLFFSPRTLLAQESALPGGKVRTYYIAADEVEWNYAPSAINPMTGQAYDEVANVFVQSGPHRIGRIYRKAIYREYTDATFQHLKPRPPEWAHLGLLGPVLRGEVGDTIKVVFRNNATHPFSVHPHGVFYAKDSEGTPYADGTSGTDKNDDAVPPGGTHTYVWPIPERAGPGPNDPSSIVWLYHSHTQEAKDVNSGLIGPIIVTARGKARLDGSPQDVDHEFVTLFMIFNENQSWYLDHNIQTYTGDPKGVNKGEINPLDPEGVFSLIGTGFVDSNLMNSINGYLYGNLPMMTMHKDQRVRWYLVTIGFGFNFHTPHWHGNDVLWKGSRTDVIAISPAQMVTVDMVPDNPGIWMYHCHVSDHMEAGMIARYQVLP